MKYQKIYFTRKASSETNEIINIVENTREKISDINNLLFNFCEKYQDTDLFNFKKDDSTQSLGEYFSYLNQLHIQANTDLEKPKLTISALGTTKAGKSTFLNSLLGYELAPVSNIELTAGTTKFIFNSNLSNNAKIKVIENTSIINEFEDSILNVYNYSKEIMESYRNENKTKTLPSPNIIIESNFLIGKERGFSGLDESIEIEIIDLPGLKNISDSNNLKVIQDNLKASLITLVIDYNNLFEPEKREILYKELIEIVSNTGNTSNIIFLLNKINLRTEESDDIYKILDECKNEIKKKLNLTELPDVIPINAHLLFYVQSVFWAYKNGNLTEYIFSSELEEPNSIYLQTIKENLLKLFNSLNMNIFDHINDNYEDIATKLKNKIKKEKKIPSYKDFEKFWSACMDNSGYVDSDSEQCRKIGGSLEFFNIVQSRVQNNIRELIIGPALSSVIKEYNKFFSIMENAIEIGKINTHEKIEQSKKDLENINSSILSELEKIESDFKSKIENVKPKIKSNKSEDFSQALAELGFSETNKFDFLIKRVIRDVETNTINYVKSSFEERRRSSSFLEFIENKWKPELCKSASEHYEDIKTLLYNSEESINKGKTFNYLESELKTKNEVEKINSSLTEFKKLLQESIISQTKFQMQKNVSDLSELLKDWLLNKNKNASDNLNDYITKLGLNISLPSINLPEIEYSFDKTELLNDIHNKKIDKYTSKIGTRKKPKVVSSWIFWTTTIFEDVPIYETQNKFTICYPSVRDLAKEWSTNLSNTYDDLWKGFCDVLIELLNLSLHEYKSVINDVLAQFIIMLEIKQKELDEEKEIQTKVWDDISDFYSITLNKSQEIKSMIRSN